MSFESPWVLLALLLLLPMVVLYLRAVWAHSSAFAYFPGAGLIVPRGLSGRHLPALLFLSALVLALMAAARPTARLLLPDNLSGVMLVIEASSAMLAQDIAPNRLQATQQAAKALVRRLLPETKVGLVTFSDYGTLNVPLTSESQSVLDGIDLLNVGGGYSFTYGLIEALKTLPDKAPDGKSPGVIVLFSHGHDRSGNDPLALADQAAQRGIRVYTIGVGTYNQNFDENMLERVANRSGGHYYPVKSAEELRTAYQGLSKIIALSPKVTEVGGPVAGLAGILLALSLGLGTYRRQVV